MIGEEPVEGRVNDSCCGWTRAYAPQLILDPHVHHAPRLCVVLGGSFDEKTDGNWRCHRAGSLLYRPSGHIHQERFGPSGAACAVFNLEPAFAETISPRFDSQAAAEASSALHIARGLRLEARLRDPFSVAACQSLVWQAIILLGRESSAGYRGRALAREAGKLIENRFHQQTSLSSVSLALSVAPARLARAFAHTFGMSVGEFVQRRRCDEAAALLAAGTMPVAEIALECGFSSQAHLTTIFRRLKGTTPARFRRASH